MRNPVVVAVLLSLSSPNCCIRLKDWMERCRTNEQVPGGSAFHLIEENSDRSKYIVHALL